MPPYCEFHERFHELDGKCSRCVAVERANAAGAALDQFLYFVNQEGFSGIGYALAAFVTKRDAINCAKEWTYGSLRYVVLDREGNTIFPA